VVNFVWFKLHLAVISVEFYVINKNIDQLVKGRWLLQETLCFSGFVKNYFEATVNREVLLN
jgi:hypothetical protein